MAFDLTQRPFEGSLTEQAKKLSKEAIETNKNTHLEFGTRHGHLNMTFTPQSRVEITWRDRGGIKEGWFMKDWTIGTTLKKMKELLDS